MRTFQITFLLALLVALSMATDSALVSATRIEDRVNLVPLEMPAEAAISQEPLALEPALNLSDPLATLEVVWVDDFTGRGSPPIYTLVFEDGSREVVEFAPGSTSVPPYQLARKQLSVSVTRSAPITPSSAGRQPATLTVERAVASGAESAEALTGSRPWVTIMCKFNDVAAEPKTRAQVETLMLTSGATPGMDFYWRQMSYNKFDLAGSAVANGPTNGWFVLPGTKASYAAAGAGNGPNLNAIFSDCAAQADASVNFAPFYGVNIYLNSTLDINGAANAAYGGSQNVNRDGAAARGATWLHPNTNNGIVAHEIGHGFGLPHGGGGYGVAYDSRWDVMSAASGSCELSDVTWGCLAPGLNTFSRGMLGIFASNSIYTAPPGTTTVNLASLDTQDLTAGTYMQIRIPSPVSPSISGFDYYSVELRRRVGHDVNSPAGIGSAVVIHKVNYSSPGNGFVPGPAQVIDLDNDGDPNDCPSGGNCTNIGNDARWIAGESFSNSFANTNVTVISLGGGATPAQIQVTGGVTSCPCSVWSNDAVPSGIATGDTSDYEMGMKFQASSPGLVRGVKFYKGATNTGTHVGKLWSSAGTLLSSVTFTNETATGWQTAFFPNPISINANTTYTVSYSAPVGAYAVTGNYFIHDLVNGPLRALSGIDNGGNGVFNTTAGLFPTSSNRNNNYWVDVIFTTGAVRKVNSDFNGDGRSDAGVFRPSVVPDALWYSPPTAGGTNFQIYFGATGDIPVAGDYDGDARADAVIWRPSTGLWYGPRTGGTTVVTQFTLGQSGDIPVACDYNGDGSIDPAIYRPSTGLWYGTNAAGSAIVLNTNLGVIAGDVPAPADFNGDGLCDPAIMRPGVGPGGTNLWYSVPAGGGAAFQIYFGAAGDIPAPADYDGDGKADAVIFRPSTGLWYGPRTGGATIVTQFNLGQNGDLPVPGDYNGDAASDPAIYRPSTGLFYGTNAAGSAVVLNTNLGVAAGDIPTGQRPHYQATYPYSRTPQSPAPPAATSVPAGRATATPSAGAVSQSTPVPAVSNRPLPSATPTRTAWAATSTAGRTQAR